MKEYNIEYICKKCNKIYKIKTYKSRRFFCDVCGEETLVFNTNKYE